MKLKNKTKRLLEVNLDHPSFMQEIEHVSVTFDRATGHKGKRYVTRKVFGSLMFLAGETKTVSEQTIQVPSIKAAIDRGDLLKL